MNSEIIGPFRLILDTKGVNVEGNENSFMLENTENQLYIYFILFSIFIGVSFQEESNELILRVSDAESRDKVVMLVTWFGV